MSKNDFFIGYADTPKKDRRFFLTAGLGLMVGTAALGTGIAALQNSPGPGTWDQADIRDFNGIVTADPYPMLRTSDVDGAPKTVLLACLGKCGVRPRLGNLAGQAVTVRGSLIQRGPHAMIAVVDDMDWITAAEDASVAEGLAFDTPQPWGDVALAGEIVDSKCWFGAMRPSEGKVHKSCAALCIRGGLPPILLVRDKQKRELLLVMTNAGAAHGEDLLPLVADPVFVRGEARRMGDILLLDAPVSAITRL